jgi:DNA-binding NarL/FixJ family response regulator
MNESIMLVEDEMITALDLRRMLEKVGYRVSATISSGEEAVRMVKEILPDLIIMDIFLGSDMDGIEASSLISLEHDVPVIFLTANADSNTIRRADRIRHYGYLIKPVRQTDLDSIVSTALQRHQIERNIRERSFQ